MEGEWEGEEGRVGEIREEGEGDKEGRALGEVATPSKCTQPWVQKVPQVLGTQATPLTTAPAPTLVPRLGATKLLPPPPPVGL